MIKYKNFLTLRERPNTGYFPAYYCGSYVTEKRTKTRYSHSIQAFIFLFDKKKFFGVFATHDDVKKIGKNILKAILEDKKFVRKKRKEGVKIGKKLLKFCEKNLAEEKLKKSKNEKLAQLYLEYVKLYSDYCFAVLPLWNLHIDELYNYLKNRLKKIQDKKKVFEYLHILITPIELSYVALQELELIKIISRIERKKALKTVFGKDTLENIKKELKDYFFVASSLNKHVKNFGWIPFDFIGPNYWHIDYFIKEIKKFFIRKKSTREEIKRLKKEYKQLKREQMELIRNLKITREEWRLCKDMQLIALMQNETKKFRTKSHVFLQTKLLPEISKRTKIPVNLLRFMTEHEIRDALHGKKFDLKELKARNIYSVIIKDKNGRKIITGNKAKEYFKFFLAKEKEITELRGKPASLGSATGRAKILLSSKEIGKIYPGDILIATMTTPDYVPAMKKVAAIVTNEGGITCHAAIISRELGIPCVIGTKIATEVIKDNYYIKVDANKGIVKILRKD